MTCTCLTADDSSLPHYPRCEMARDDSEADTSALRELAELAALRDIDTALSIFRTYRPSIKRVEGR